MGDLFPRHWLAKNDKGGHVNEECTPGCLNAGVGLEGCNSDKAPTKNGGSVILPEGPVGTDAHMRWTEGLLQQRGAEEGPRIFYMETHTLLPGCDRDPRFVSTIVMRPVGGVVQRRDAKPDEWRLFGPIPRRYVYWYGQGASCGKLPRSSHITTGAMRSVTGEGYLPVRVEVQSQGCTHARHR